MDIHKSKHDRKQAVQVAFNGGTIAALVVVSLAVLGICVMYVLFESMYVDTTGIRSSDIPLLMVSVAGIGKERGMMLAPTQNDLSTYFFAYRNGPPHNMQPRSVTDLVPHLSHFSHNWEVASTPK